MRLNPESSSPPAPRGPAGRGDQAPGLDLPRVLATGTKQPTKRGGFEIHARKLSAKRASE